uniref:Uncharacterized protein n=1 Tax=Romanomermis culicivorax TaxID=13658 RepID=A0A915KFQ8_ROMCU
MSLQKLLGPKTLMWTTGVQKTIIIVAPNNKLNHSKKSMENERRTEKDKKQKYRERIQLQANGVHENEIYTPPTGHAEYDWFLCREREQR